MLEIYSNIKLKIYSDNNIINFCYYFLRSIQIVLKLFIFLFITNYYCYILIKNNKIISNAYHNVIKNLWNRENNNKSFSPNEFKEKLSQENPLFAGVAANDS